MEDALAATENALAAMAAAPTATTEPDAALARVRALSCWTHLAAKGDLSIRATNESKTIEDLGLGAGRTNRNFIAEADGKRYFVRIGGDLPAYGVLRPREHAATRGAARAGIGATVVHTEAPDAMVVEFLGGRALTVEAVRAACAASTPLLSSLAAAVKTLHASPLPPELEPGGEPCWAPPDLARWLALARETGYSRLPVLQIAEELLPRLEAAAGKPAPRHHFCHFDLLADNFVHDSASGAVWLVDFEYAQGGQPLMDLAILAMGCTLAPDEEHRARAPPPRAPTPPLATPHRTTGPTPCRALPLATAHA